MGGPAVILLFAEDSGAANFIAPLVFALRAHGSQPRVLATGTGASMLQMRGINFENPDATETDDGTLTRIKPRALVVGTASNPDTRGLALIKAARRSGIPTVGVVDAAMNPDLRFRGRGDSALACAPDWILVPDEETRNAYISVGMSAEHVLALGHPHYDYIVSLAETWGQERYRQFRARTFPLLPVSRQAIIFVSEGSARALLDSGLALRGAGRSDMRSRTEAALEKLLAAIVELPARPYVVLRTHPKDRPDDFARYREQVDLISANEPALEVVYACDLVIGMTSMLMTEAALLGKPTLAIIEEPGEAQWLPGIRAGVTPVIYGSESLTPAISALLASGHRPQDPRWIALGGTQACTRFVIGLLH